MKTTFLTSALVLLLLCSCSKPETWISAPQAKTVCMQFMYRSGFTNQIALLSEEVNGRYCTYRFFYGGAVVPDARSRNKSQTSPAYHLVGGAVVPGRVRVDRQTSSVEFRR